MGYYLQIDAKDAQPLASNNGWGDAVKWVESLPPRESASLRHFCQFGWEEDLDGMESELSAALKGHEPKDHTVADTLKNWLSLLKSRGDSAVVASVTDGMGSE